MPRIGLTTSSATRRVSPARRKCSSLRIVISIIWRWTLPCLLCFCRTELKTTVRMARERFAIHLSIATWLSLSGANWIGALLSERDVASGIQWSEYLDLLFVNNYESDPTLSWQYYGATTGFLRRFPGIFIVCVTIWRFPRCNFHISISTVNHQRYRCICAIVEFLMMQHCIRKCDARKRKRINFMITAISWPPMEGASKLSKSSVSHRPVRDVYDFRMTNWFVGAANSPKDLAILIDSATYTSDRNRRLTIATTKVILDTLGPDDYVNVYRYGENAEEIVQCFKDSLVQASPENVQEMKVALSSVKHEESATNISAALSTAFEILHKYNRTGQGSQCNQAIVLITSDNDGAPTEVIKRYNWPHMPVRIFTYLIGGDKSPELRNTACSNKGNFTCPGSLRLLISAIELRISSEKCVHTFD